MRKISFYFLATCLIILSSCSKNSDNDPETPPVDKTANLQGTGDSANDILSNDNFDKLLIEIDYVQGFKPTEEAMTNFVDFFLKVYTFKENIEFVYEEVPSPDKEELTLDEIAELEGKHRNFYNTGSTLAIHIYFADAPSEDDEEDEGLVTLGAVYRNTSMIIHEATVRKLASKSPFITNADVETATINHEFGHLFGLVNLGTAMVNPHEDAEAVNHCDQEGCLMRAELQFGVPLINKTPLTENKGLTKSGIKVACALSGQSVLRMLKKQSSKGNTAIVNLDIECINDIKANGGKSFN